MNIGGFILICILFYVSRSHGQHLWKWSSVQSHTRLHIQPRNWHTSRTHDIPTTSHWTLEWRGRVNPDLCPAARRPTGQWPAGTPGPVTRWTSVSPFADAVLWPTTPLGFPQTQYKPVLAWISHNSCVLRAWRRSSPFALR